MIELIRADQYTKMLWKNGAGFTLEIARSQGEADFEWRISMADVQLPDHFRYFQISNALLAYSMGRAWYCMSMIFLPKS